MMPGCWLCRRELQHVRRPPRLPMPHQPRPVCARLGGKVAERAGAAGHRGCRDCHRPRGIMSVGLAAAAFAGRQDRCWLSRCRGGGGISTVVAPWRPAGLSPSPQSSRNRPQRPCGEFTTSRPWPLVSGNHRHDRERARAGLSSPGWSCWAKPDSPAAPADSSRNRCSAAGIRLFANRSPFRACG